MSEELIRAELEHLNRKVDSMAALLNKLHERVMSTPVCPAPGLCVQLDRASTDQEKRIRALERRDGMILGACVIINIVVVVAIKLM